MVENKKEIIGKGAEAIIYREGNKVIKDRIKKGYREEQLDLKLRKQRTRIESKIINKANKIINSPKILRTNPTEIIMEFIEGKKLSNYLSKENYKEILNAVGKDVAKLHDNNIIHGDLTTSNMILKDNKIFFIDFGLAYISKKVEDKAVDIHLLKQALESKHYELTDAFEEFLKGYKQSKNYEEVMKRFEIVEGRGRYKHKQERESRKKKESDV